MLRAFDTPDVPHLVRVWNEMAEADGMHERRGIDHFSALYAQATPTHDPWADVVIAETAGRVVGYGRHQWVDTGDGVREHRVWIFVGPEHRGTTAERLQDWLNHRAREVAQTQGRIDRPRVLGSWALEGQDWRRRLLEGRGFSAVRWTIEMERPSLEDIAEPPVPDGISLRGVDADAASLRRVWDASGEAFEDHWGGIDRSDAAFEVWRTDPNTDPALFVVALDGAEIAGGVLPIVNAAENRALGVNRGWLMSVFVRRAWRRRGIGAALVAAALGRLRDHGLSSAVLTVDADNPTGALGIYQRAGFILSGREISYRRGLWDEPESGR